MPFVDARSALGNDAPTLVLPKATYWSQKLHELTMGYRREIVPTEAEGKVMTGIRRGLALSAILLAVSPAMAAPVWLGCRALGNAGNVSFKVALDEATGQAPIVWSAGGGRPSASLTGDAGTDYPAAPPSFSPTEVSASYRTSTLTDPGVSDPYAYRIEISRVDGTVRFTRYDGSVSTGKCTAIGSGGLF